MSSARANAAARSRRASGADLSTPTQSVQTTNKTQQLQQQKGPAPKLSISDAIGLITLRLGRVENIVHTIKTDPSTNVFSTDESTTDVAVNESVFNNIVARIEQLEETEVQTPVLDPLYDEQIATLTSTLKTVQTELSTIKDLVTKLQMFTMETNQKLIDAVLNANAPRLVTTTTTNLPIPTTDVPESETTKDKPNLNLKELIKQELASNK